MHGLLHHAAALLHRLAHLGRAAVGGHRRFGIVLHHGRDLFHADHGLRHVRGLQLGARRQGLVVLGERVPGLRDQGRVAADFGHHAGQGHHHAVQQAGHLRQLIGPMGRDAVGQIALGRVLHGRQQARHLMGQAAVDAVQHIQEPQARRRRQAHLQPRRPALARSQPCGQHGHPAADADQRQLSAQLAVPEHPTHWLVHAPPPRVRTR